MYLPSEPHLAVGLENTRLLNGNAIERDYFYYCYS